jgi:hypothetical protein
MLKLNLYDVLVDSKFYSIINKLGNFASITDIFKGRYFNIETNSPYLINDNKYVKCYISQLKGFIKYVKPEHIKQEYNYYKIITPTGCHKAYSGFGELYILNENEIHTTSYVQFKISNRNEAVYLTSYLKTKLPNLMLSLRKNSQLISKNTCKWIPLVPLNKKWTDEEVYKYFKLSEDEIKLVKETKVIGYNDIKTDNTNEPKIIKDGRKQYYLVGDKLYKVKKDKSHGELFGRYIDGEIVDGVENIDEEIITKSKKPFIKKSITKPINEIQIDEPIVEIKKPKNNIIKKSIIQPINEIQIDVPVIETKKLNKQKSKNFIKDKFI